MMKKIVNGFISFISFMLCVIFVTIMNYVILGFFSIFTTNIYIFVSALIMIESGLYVCCFLILENFIQKKT
jgi:hypothetical protein